MSFRMWRWLDWNMGCLAFAFLAAVFGLASARINYDRESVCLAHGFPEYKSGGDGGYCIKRVNQTDSVVALSSLRRLPEPGR